ncbi:MAG TPA: alkaline phosphatase family protein [Candidatus Dormibacteraeota bacterium]|nr:alkaline phosphatase family protein [Candidatus Dormibacteraeota bacterium]
MKRAILLALVAAVLGPVVTPVPAAAASGADVLSRIDHIVVIYQENWSFDSLYGKFPGANGLANAGDSVKQVDKSGQPYATLPRPIDNNQKPAAPDPRFPANLPVQPFDAAKYVPDDMKTGDLVHRYYQEQYQIDGGKMDKFIAWSDAAGLVMSYYDATSLPEGKLAQQYVMDDNFFHAAFGGSFLNHIFLICACAPSFFNAPASAVAKLDANGVMVQDGSVTPDGFAVNTSFSVNTPHPATAAPASLVPNQSLPTIGDRLNDRNLSWAWYSGGWNDAIAGHPDPLFQFHHQPFVYFTRYADGTQLKKDHLKDEQDFLAAAKGGALPAVSFVKPIGEDNEHPGYADLLRGQQHVADLVQAVQQGANWKDTMVVITYDEHGGRWDHVAPPKVDQWGPGTRVPTIVISPLAKKGFVDHTQYDTTSILRTIEQRWDLPPLASRDARAASLVNALDPAQAPAVAAAGPSPSVAVIVLGALVVLAVAGLVAGALVRRGNAA